ncbi:MULTISPECIES: LysR family transcriptional regulator [unclassified Ruegeria]|uniref:LysR family transcriptional regulator n=2 Tax=unclassified Ruegeria TaxID=2625375 RepID=UPI00148943F7|nr:MULTISPECIES: LysR family transcriptional regulator [unclassified Ruegeria]NOD36497.1 LysR family transcriptional regulator [Ruegeria sp. HKCCD7296]NOE34600.1 LysR family transcriptional regulator [Ruegeria sp. HKCCD7318]NOE43736.1 LysR family transcriptional regulator [Ruegeria sp. HKCCD7319]
MRLPLATLEVFTAIAQQGSLRAAAEALGVKPSTVSHQLKSLEDQLGTALFIRTTRSISLTEAGRALIRGAGPAFDQLSEAVESARSTGHAARGTLKLAMPEFAYHLYVSPILNSFCAKFPEIELELSLTDALSDILGEELHAGFRLGDRVAPDMVAVRLTRPLPVAVTASPAYLTAHGTPKEPRDLLEHNCVRYRFHSSGQIAPWSFNSKDGSYSVQVQGNLITNTLPASVDMAKLGLGLVYTFRAYVAAEIDAGLLKPVLEDHLGLTPGIFLYFPREYRSMMPLKLFIEHIKQQETL